MTITHDLLTEKQCVLLLNEYGHAVNPEYHVDGLRGVVGMLVKCGKIDIADVGHVLAVGTLKPKEQQP